MSTREIATMDIRQELESSGKCFLAFHEELSPAINSLALIKVINQKQSPRFVMPAKTNSQLVARCFFCNGEARLVNYDRYYRNGV